ncbi:P-loop containing nucleoside triphosphate hydrolase protein [Roridomyces roridus]|uniref:P-loop containing nucleoside triphosphate hydrolase protein n=1 Tax=Roridomyces roridus TaxID=1738132 RepID=A0AAD7AZQ9_9AGAR|nr:P-loop containing nucleoside triphosphate hydrolase protein [Roridomyces roridus]
MTIKDVCSTNARRRFGISTSLMTSSYLSASEYANRRKQLLALMSQLRSVGAQGELDLPRIAVIGNQSAGKSSVVEAISGINVPRDSGTCTRCPLECRLASAPEWACRISIRREFDFSGRRIAGEVSEIPFGDLIRNRDEVEMMLRRAQLAVLDPTLEIARIMRMELKELKETLQDRRTAEFSKNVVCIDLEGPDLTDVQFVDLPGIIQNASPAVIRLVEEMVVDNIKGNCLILVAIPMTDDIENQKAMTLAREQDPDGIRTIGVLTKPDLLSTGSTTARALWLDVLEGRRHSLHHGYYCTRQPDDEERTDQITTAEARSVEAAFFQQTAPWADCTEQQRLGTPNLVSTLSRCLVQMIGETLPRIVQTANTHLEECRKALSAVPEPPKDDPATHLLTLITTFCAEIRQAVQGSAESTELIHRHNGVYRAFKGAIAQSAPGFVAGLPLAAEESTGARPNILTDVEDGTGPSVPIYLSDVRETLNRTRTRELPGDLPPAAKATMIQDFQVTWGRAAEDCFQSVMLSMSDLLSAALELFFSRFSGLKRGLWTYLRALIQDRAQDCARYLEAILEMEKTPMTLNDDVLQAATEKWVMKYKDQRAGRTPTFVPAVVVPGGPFDLTGVPDRFTFQFTSSSGGAGGPSSRSTTPAPTAQNQAPKPNSTPAPSPAPAASSSPPSSNPFNTPAPMTALPGFRATTPIMVPHQPQNANEAAAIRPVDEVLAMLARLGYTGLREEDLGRLQAGDEYETEIHLMSGVRAYFEVSYRRIIDIVPGMIDSKFVRALSGDLQAKLIGEFKLGQPDGHAKCSEYLTEDPAVVARRADLVQRLHMLEIVQKELLDFGNGGSDADGSENES